MKSISSTAPTTATPQISVAVIGASGRVFQPIDRFLQSQSSNLQLHRFPTIGAVLQSLAAGQAAFDLCLILQSWSEQYSRRDADQLIGLTLRSRLLCSYGPWCEADGRTQSIWPEAVRIPAWLTVPVLQTELHRCRYSLPGLPVTAARDEAFSHRLGAEVSQTVAGSDPTKTAVIISDDRVFAETLQQILEQFGRKTVVLRPHRAAEPAQHLPGPAAEIELVVFDVEPWDLISQQLLNLAAQNYPDAMYLAVDSLPDSVRLPEEILSRFAAFLPRLDLVNGLQHQLY